MVLSMRKDIEIYVLEIKKHLDSRPQTWLSERSGVTRPQISRILGLKHPDPTIGDLDAMAKVFNTSYVELIAAHKIREFKKVLASPWARLWENAEAEGRDIALGVLEAHQRSDQVVAESEGSAEGSGGQSKSRDSKA